MHILALFIFFLTFSLDSFAYKSNLQITATIQPLYGIVEYIAHDIAETNLLLDKNQSAHSFSLRPSQVKLLENSDLVFYIGDELEHFMHKYEDNENMIEVSQFKELTLIDYKQQDEIIEHDHSDHDHDHIHVGHDLHIWLLPKNALIIASNVANILISKDPSNAKLYKDNLSKFQNELAILDKNIAKELLPYKNYGFVSGHNAFGYFAKQYNLNYLGGVTFHHEENLSIQTLKYLETNSKSGKLNCILGEYHSDNETLQNLATTMQIGFAESDPEWYNANATSYKGNMYFGIMSQIGSAMVSCFSNNRG